MSAWTRCAGVLAAMWAWGCAPHGEAPQRLESEVEAGVIGGADRGCAEAPGPAEDPAEAFAAGERDATLDLVEGALALEVYGSPSACRATYAALLRRDYGVELRPVGCRVSAARSEHARGYNGRARRAIEARFGAGALARAADLAGC